MPTSLLASSLPCVRNGMQQRGSPSSKRLYLSTSTSEQKAWVFNISLRSSSTIFSSSRPRFKGRTNASDPWPNRSLPPGRTNPNILSPPDSLSSTASKMSLLKLAVAICLVLLRSSASNSCKSACCFAKSTGHLMHLRQWMARSLASLICSSQAGQRDGNISSLAAAHDAKCLASPLRVWKCLEHQPQPRGVNSPKWTIM
ncbi:hypothetical protein BKA57DRAFT_469550 [Linnemannia elongata]|nr:hypothetical protein BKA57DRAFT_469550 [Linnemannia elongata]